MKLKVSNHIQNTGVESEKVGKEAEMKQQIQDFFHEQSRMVKEDHSFTDVGHLACEWVTLV